MTWDWPYSLILCLFRRTYILTMCVIFSLFNNTGNVSVAGISSLTMAHQSQMMLHYGQSRHVLNFVLSLLCFVRENYESPLFGKMSFLH